MAGAGFAAAAPAEASKPARSGVEADIAAVRAMALRRDMSAGVLALEASVHAAIPAPFRETLMPNPLRRAAADRALIAVSLGGQFLPPAYLGGAVADPRQYHLRRPPNGYGWVTVGPNAYLTQRSTGLILDTAPLY